MSEENFEKLTEEEKEMLTQERGIYNKKKKGYWSSIFDTTAPTSSLIMILFGVILPIGAFATNLYLIPFPVCFYSPELYTALFIGFLGITITALWKGHYPKLLALFTVHATFLGVVYSSIFSLGFIPIIPVSIFALMLYGLGILGFSPFLSLWVFIRAYRMSFNIAKEYYNRNTLIISCIIINIFLPIIYCGARTGMAYIVKKDIYRAIHCEEEEKPEVYKSLLKNPLIKNSLVNIYAYNETPFDTLAGYLMPAENNYRQNIYGNEASTLYYLLYGEKIEVAEKENLKKIKIGYRNSRYFDEYIEDSDYYTTTSLTNCQYDGIINLDSLLSYQEVTLDVSSKWQKQEMVCEFKVPPGGVVTKLSLWINGEEHLASIGAKDRAEQAYETIVSKQRDPAIITWIGGNNYQLKVFPVEPNMPRKIKIGVTAPLSPGEKGLSFLPVIFQSRNFGIDEKEKTTAIIDVRSKDEKFDLIAVSKKMKISSLGKYEKRAETTINGFSPDDFRLLIDTPKKEEILSYSSEKFTYYQIPFYPDFNKQKAEPVCVTYFLDCTYQMEKDKIFDQAKEAIIKSINNLKEEDRFNIIGANFEIKKLFSSSQNCTKENIKKAEEFLNSLKTSGGMDIVPVFDSTFFPDNYDLQPVFLGIVHSRHPIISYGEYCIQKASRYEGISAGVVLVGYDENSFVSDLVQGVEGFSLRVKDPANLEQAFSRVEEAGLMGGKYKLACECISSDKDIVPVPSTKMHVTPSNPLFFYVRLPEDYKKSLLITIEEPSGTILRTVDLKKEAREISDDHIGRLWACNYLIEAHKKDLQNKLSDKEFSELVTLAKDYYMVSPYTALIVLEKEEQYKQFGIDRNYKGEMSAPSIPEPETILMVLVVILISIFIYYKTRPIMDSK